ncbi:MAG TPA: hypothetical protein VJ724_09390, partial [Tahibacter sp.]|nr:hypothetical protein [Tahibacter sp.]
PGAIGLQAGVAGLDAGRAELQKRAATRVDWIRRADEAKANNLPLPPFVSGAIDTEEGNIKFNGEVWDPKDNPVKFDWLPEAGNKKLNELVGNLRDNIRHGIRDPKHLVAKILDVLPQTLFVMMPLFAVMLKFFYMFKRRLYMEHLIVALHSHAFLSLTLLFVGLLGLAGSWFPSFARTGGAIMTGLACWVPIYLFLMQKRVYKQGWIMTTLKFGMIGTCYTVLLTFAALAAAIVSLMIKS